MKSQPQALKRGELKLKAINYKVKRNDRFWRYYTLEAMDMEFQAKNGTVLSKMI